MESHAYFNLILHTDDELCEILKTDLRSRQTIHEWPLSCVQLLTTLSGERYIYKSQYGPTVEAQFYARAKSSLLPKAETLYNVGGYVVLLLDYIEGGLLEDQGYSTPDIIQVGRSLVEAISQIAGDVPCYYDISTAELWREYAQQTLHVCAELIRSGTFASVTESEIAYLREWAFSKSVIAKFHEKVNIVHGDATGNNVFVTPTGYKVIDWQRPLKGPSEIDRVALLESQNVDSLEYVDAAITGIFYFTRLAWTVECQTRWIPQATCYDGWVKGYIEKIKKTDSKD